MKSIRQYAKQQQAILFNAIHYKLTIPIWNLYVLTYNAIKTVWNEYHGPSMRIWKTYGIHNMWMDSTCPVIVMLSFYENFNKNFATYEKTMKSNIANFDCYKNLWIVQSGIYTLWITFNHAAH